MSKRLAKVNISYALFRQMFHFPDDTNIISFEIDASRWGQFFVLIESQELPEIQDGERIPEATPRYRSYFGENSEIIKIEREDWCLR